MRQGGGQASPDPLSLVSPPPPRRRAGGGGGWSGCSRRWGRCPRVWGWFDPTHAVAAVFVWVFAPVLSTVLALERGAIPERAGDRAMVLAIGNGVLCGVAVAIGAWLAR